MADDLLTLKPEPEVHAEATTCNGTTSVDGNPFVLAWQAQLAYAAAFVTIIASK